MMKYADRLPIDTAALPVPQDRRPSGFPGLVGPGSTCNVITVFSPISHPAAGSVHRVGRAVDAADIVTAERGTEM